ncbi:DUF1697 domain-containing protein [Cellulomonas marina]|uniref:Uncharacterized conserved protein, DUF1697 family n=1 Tax=Cellulomonas marina TaxID=988821 RepID=A0A1I0X0K4_9CELL|nr:DUF1697 domain-containing protein [Cellulomonas marina]GIG29349.1 hypothetical protein Cma02nite_19490 [Cellulomonas marina]SFA94354.1 Uncharacterized conserved protein, DUF1697 family [Cellulomonas marina]
MVAQERAARVVGLLRAVNVGGRTVRSADLRRITEAAGHTDVRTYAASGNVVLTTADPEAAPADVAAGLSAALAADLGLDVPVVVRTATELDALVQGCPFPDVARQEPTHLAVAFWDGDVVPGAAGTDLSRYGGEAVVWTAREAYLHYPDGQGRSRLTLDVLSRVAGRIGTARNWRTVLALQELART